jgi:predicted nicotinamide N-methyase
VPLRGILPQSHTKFGTELLREYSVTMPSYKTLRTFFIGDQQLELFIPSDVLPEAGMHSPYWGKVWPAALGLCTFLQNNLQYVQQKKIVEIAAGLGLPSIFTAPHAVEVYCTDIEPAAVELVKQSVLHNKLRNVQCAVADWNEMGIAGIPDVILLSDVNYEPVQFAALQKVIACYLQQQCTVILSSPQRLMAKPFIEQLLQYCVQQEEVMVTEKETETAVSIFVLRQV